MRLRPIRIEDVSEISRWPAYGDGFEQMGYALRDNDWIDEFRDRPGTWIYVAEEESQLLGFSLLSMTSDAAAEFRIAVYPRFTGQGVGKEVTLATLKIGFCEHRITRIHLIARKTNPRAVKLYESIRFEKTGESTYSIQGNRIEFTDMAITEEAFNIPNRPGRC